MNAVQPVDEAHADEGPPATPTGVRTSVRTSATTVELSLTLSPSPRRSDRRSSVEPWVTHLRSHSADRLLLHAQQHASRLKTRVSLTFFVLGHAIVLAALALVFLAVHSSMSLGTPDAYAALVAPGMALAYLGLLPTDGQAILAAVFLTLVIGSITGLLLVPLGVLALTGHTHIVASNHAERVVHVCTGFAIAVNLLVTGVALVTGALRLKPGHPPMCAPLRDARRALVEEHGRVRGHFIFVLAPPAGLQLAGAMALPPRSALRALWRTCRLSWALVGLTFIAHGIAGSAVSAHYARHLAWGSYASGAVWLACACVSTHRVRLWCQHRLMRLVATRSAREAAEVAALLARGKASAIMCRAKTSFRGIPFAALAEADFFSDADPVRLYEKTSPAELGEVDAFISHSWSDEAGAKWAALAAWARHFEEVHARQPTVWLDKACIRQASIEEDIACLPIWLAGCRQLLVVLGETYPRRLWCAMELYTFVRMGGSQDNIVVLPITKSRKQALRLMAKFELDHAQCALEDDRQHLLAVIETGHAWQVPFDVVVRHVLAGGITVEEC